MRNAPNLRIVQGNVVDRDTITKCLIRPDRPGTLVDAVVYTIGGSFSLSKMSNDELHVCEQGMKALVAALKDARTNGGATGQPTIVAVSTTGMSVHGRDYPASLWPIYGLMLKQPHKDKTAMEALMVGSGERFTIVRASLLTNGAESKQAIRVGIEDPKTRKLESKEIGYTISREDVGKWIFDSVLSGDEARWNGKVVSITS